MSKVHLSGTLTCSQDDLEMLTEAVKLHVELTRAEPGCERFEVVQSPDNSCVFNVNETFADAAAFEAHQARTRASAWWGKTQHIARDFTMTND
ncbi:MAG: antibiotic biosynthesis monooxygenase [Rhodobacteraceae bacterium]|nr:antibiotic biosynthesis monooxygenase [Paracoccaceae bacterium]